MDKKMVELLVRLVEDAEMDNESKFGWHNPTLAKELKDAKDWLWDQENELDWNEE